MTSEVHPAGLAVLALILLAVVGGLGFLLSTGGLTRFQQTSLICSDPMIGPFEMVLNGRHTGDDVRLIRPEGEVKLTIDAREGAEVLLTLGAATLRVNPETGDITVLQGRRSSISTCRITDFAM